MKKKTKFGWHKVGWNVLEFDDDIEKDNERELEEEDYNDYIIPSWVVYDKETAEYINVHSGAVINAHYILTNNGAISAIRTDNLICGEACWYKGKYLICIKPISNIGHIATAHEGDHRDKNGITWPNEGVNLDESS